MIEKNFKKILSLGIVATSVLAINPIGASAEWKSNSTGWWYTEGDSWATGWREIDGKWYYFDSDGYMEKSCYVEDYYLNNQGTYVNLKYTANDSKFNEFLKRLYMIEVRDSEALKHAATTYDYINYSKNFGQQYDSLLNDIYNNLKENMSQTDFAKLQTGEVNWINEKETAMKNSIDDAKGGSMASYIGGLTSLGYTHDRIYELLKYVNR